ncbi:MAG: TolC family protein, partial [Terriglobales bacterium]
LAATLPGQVNAPQPQTQAMPTRLTVADAESIALKNNPQISVARLNALASHQVTRETRAGFLPTATINITGVDAEEGSRIGAGGLNNPVLYDRAAAGTTLSQLITDFGRTSNLLASSKLRAEAEDESARATAQQITLAADEAFYNVLQSAALLKVADETVKSRQLVVDRIQALTNAKLKSDLDLSFANVDLSQAKLLQLEAQNNHSVALASLSAVLGYPNLQNVELVEETGALQPPAPNIDELIQTALRTRPDLNALQYDYQSAAKFRNAEHDLSRPTVSALGTVGSVPFNTGHLDPWYGAVGANISIPVFNGFLFSARAHEADLRAQAAEQRRRDLANRIARDVRTAWFDAIRTYNRLDVTRQLLNEASLAEDLTQTRYKLGLATIVEYTQAELQRTQAEIGNTSAQYEYRVAQARLQFELGQK